MKSKIVIAALILLAVIACRRKASDDYNYYKPAASDSVAVADTIKTVAAEQDTVAVVAEPEPEIKGVDLNDNYFIVVASYAVEDYAVIQKKDLESQGYKPQVFMINEDGWYKLAVESYKKYDDAKTALEEVKSRGGIFGNARIVFKKSK